MSAAARGQTNLYKEASRRKHSAQTKMADPTPMDVDEAPTDLVLPDVMEGMLRMAALTTPDLSLIHISEPTRPY